MVTVVTEEASEGNLLSFLLVIDKEEMASRDEVTTSEDREEEDSEEVEIDKPKVDSVATDLEEVASEAEEEEEVAVGAAEAEETESLLARKIDKLSLIKNLTNIGKREVSKKRVSLNQFHSSFSSTRP